MTMRRSGTESMTMSEGSISREMPSSAKPSKACNKRNRLVGSFSHHIATVITHWMDEQSLITFLLLFFMSYGSNIS